MFYTVLIIWLLLDQLSKYYVMNHFLLGESLPVIPNVFHLTYIINRGAAFGMLATQRWFFFARSGHFALVYVLIIGSTCLKGLGHCKLDLLY